MLTTLGPAPFLSLLGILGRNLPLVLLLGGAGTLVWQKAIHDPGTAVGQAEAKPSAFHNARNLKGIEVMQRRRMAVGTFVIAVLLAGAVLTITFGPFASALPTPYFIG